MSKKYNRVAVLKGGWSPEREVSLNSGAAAAKALREAGYDAVEIDAGRDLVSQLKDANPDAAFKRAPWPVGRGWLRSRRSGNSEYSLHPFRRPRFGAGDGQAAGKSRF